MDRSKEDIQFCVHELGKALSATDSTINRLESVFARHPEWNDEVKYTVQDAVVQLGLAIGSLVTWFDDVPGETKVGEE